MKDDANDIRALLYRAMMSQVELGLGEVIVKPPPKPAQPLADPFAPSPEQMRIVSPEDLFGSTVMEEPTSSQYSSLEEHREAIKDCSLCPLHATRTNFVYGVGNPNADLMIVGEAPGAEEDRRGEPFVGRAGQLLDKILAAIQLSRQEVYITNILKSRPPNNRDPLPEEMTACMPYLYEQIRLIRPKLICALGRISAQALLQTSTPLGKLRKRWHEFRGTPLLVTYHPAALLRFPAYKRDTWEDMQMLKARLDSLK